MTTVASLHAKAMAASEFLEAIQRGESVTNVRVEGRVQTAGTVFAHPVRVDQVHFADEVSFIECTFRRGAQFSRTWFHRQTKFCGSTFVQASILWRARFLAPADLSDIQTVRGDSRWTPGELNLAWARFEQTADLKRIHVAGPLRMWRTVFLRDVNMWAMHLEGPAVLSSKASEITLTADDVSLDQAEWPPFFQRLTRTRIAKAKADSEFPDVLWLDVASAENLRNDLMAHGFEPTAVDSVVTAYRNEARSMFQPNTLANLTGIELVGEGNLELVDLDLSQVRCLLGGTPLARAKLNNVHWPAERLAGFMRRYRTEDEVANGAGTFADPSNTSRCHRLYVDLGAAYEAQQEDEPASRFRVSAREMARRSQRGTTRAISTLYRYFAGYGEGRGLALLWLVAFVFVLFPAAFVLVHSPEVNSFPQAVVRSLEVAAFLQPSDAASATSGAGASLPLRFLVGVERVIVSGQVGFLLLAVRRLFPR